MSINEWWSVDGNIGIDSWVVGLGTSVTPWGGTNNLVVVFDWSTRITLACVFTATTDSSTEHTLQDGTIVWTTGVTVGVGDDVNVDTVEFAWVRWSWVLRYMLQEFERDHIYAYFCVSPSTDSDTCTTWHPFAVLVSWESNWWNTRSRQVEWWTEFEDTDIVGLSSVVILWMVDPSSNRFLLLGWFVLFDVMSTTNSSDTGALAVSSRDDTVGTDDWTTTEMRTTSLERDNVWFRSSGWDGSTNNLKRYLLWDHKFFFLTLTELSAAAIATRPAANFILKISQKIKM